MTSRPDNQPLWWCATGNLRCRDHLPLPGSASWWTGNWSMLPPEDRERITRLNGHTAACEVCSQHATGAHADYLAARAAVAHAITALVARLDDLDTAEDAHQQDRSYAGTLWHVAAALADLASSASTRRDG